MKQKEENLKNMIVNDYDPKLLLEHNYQFYEMDGGGNHHSFRSSVSQVNWTLEKQSSFLGGNPSLVMFPFPFSSFFFG